MNTVFVLDVFHVLEYAADAVNAIHPDKSQRKQHLEEFKANILAGDTAKVIQELEPFRAQFKEVEAACRYFSNNIDRMQYDQFRNHGLQIGSGVVEGGCKQYGLRLKRSGARWLGKGANAMLALKTVVMNHRLTDFLDWRVNQNIVMTA